MNKMVVSLINDFCDKCVSLGIENLITIPNIYGNLVESGKYPDLSKKYKTSVILNIIKSTLRKRKNIKIKNKPKNENNNLNQSLRELYSKNKTNNVKDEEGNGNNAKKRKIEKTVITFSKPKVRFEDIGGCESILQEIKEFIVYPLKHPKIYEQLGVSPPRGVLFCGPSGCGKTLMAMAVANECNVKFLRFSSPEIVAGISGESESKLREIFDDAKKNEPCILLIDEIDAICSSESNNMKAMDRRIMAQLISCLDDLNFEKKSVIIIGTTSKPESLEKSLRRGGRFDKEINFKIPGKEARKSILKKLTLKTKMSDSVNFEILSQKTPGFVGADLSLLIKEAVKSSLRRIFEKLEKLENNKILKENDNSNDKTDFKEEKVIDLEKKGKMCFLLNKEKEVIDLVKDEKKDLEETELEIKIDSLMKKNEYCQKSDINDLEDERIEDINVSMEDFLNALKSVVPGFKRYGFSSIPKTTWDEIGGLDKLHEEMRLAVVFPILYPELYRRQGLGGTSGVLFYGPPGCGKTLMAKAIANEAQTSFISIKGPELLNSYVGESEKAIRALFRRAMTCAPCIIFFDEIESLVPKRFGSRSSSEVSLRVVTQMLTELDGLEDRDGVFVVAASNRPDAIDSAILRPGRIGRIIHVPLPSEEGRKQIFEKHLKKIPCENVERVLDHLSNKTDGFSGADCANLVQRAASIALGNFFESTRKGDEKSEIEKSLKEEKGIEVKISHFEEALKKLKRSVSEKSVKFYSEMEKVLSKA